MNTRMIGFLLGRILMVEAGLLALPLLTALLYGEPLMPWLATMLVLAAIGGALSLRKPERTALYAKDGFAAVALVWLLMSAFGALPFVLSGDIPNYIDAFFETVSGFTTTGASILTAVEPLSRGGLFWRSFTHWVGGMGVLVFVMAILPMSDGHTMHILRAEMPGPTAGKLVSRMSDTAKILYGMYFVMTLVMIGLLLLGGMDLFDASVHAFFQVSSIITTTGYATVDFDQWPGYAKTVLVLLMFVGGCAGSTGGGLKVTRVVTLVKAAFMDMRKMIHPNAVVNVRMEGRAMPEKQVRGVQAYFSVYMLLYAVSWLLLSLNGFDLLSTFTALSACINNIGPGLGMVGPTGNFSAFAPWAKLLLSFDMLAGRLEIFPMLLLFVPSTWRGNRLRRWERRN